MTQRVLFICAAALAASLFSAQLRRTVPELAGVLSLAASVLILLAVLRERTGLAQLAELCTRLVGEGREEAGILLKCTGIAVVSSFGGASCRENGNTGLASAVELAGIFMALACASPLLLKFLESLERYV